jgi:hypothetical protein
MYRATLFVSAATCALQFGPQALASSTVAKSYNARTILHGLIPVMAKPSSCRKVTGFRSSNRV